MEAEQQLGGGIRHSSHAELTEIEIGDIAHIVLRRTELFCVHDYIMRM